jgi:hypothetical protein
MPIVQHLETIARAPAAALDTLARAVWQEFAAGKLAEAEATTVVEAIEARRRALRQPVQGHSQLRVAVVREGEKRMPAGNVEARVQTPARGPRQLVLRVPRPALYDRAKSRERRHRLAYSGPLPARLAAQFTPAELAVLRIIADEHRDRGGCALCIDEIAARAGVCRRTVQNALRHAERLGLVSITERRREGARSLPNIVRIISREWLAWAERSGKARDRGDIGCRALHTTDSLCFTKGLRGSDARVTAGAAQQPYNQGPDRAHRHSALRA